MFKNFLLIILFLFSYSYVCSAQITTSNYKKFIGKKIKFADTISKKQSYKVANKTLRTKKYVGKTATISNIELDKKGNIILFLTTSFDKKEKQLK